MCYQSDPCWQVFCNRSFGPDGGSIDVLASKLKVTKSCEATIIRYGRKLKVSCEMNRSGPKRLKLDPEAAGFTAFRMPKWVLEDWEFVEKCVAKLPSNIYKQIGPRYKESNNFRWVEFGIQLDTKSLHCFDRNCFGYSHKEALVRVLKLPNKGVEAHAGLAQSWVLQALESPKKASSELFDVRGVKTRLLEFQCQTLRWCLARENLRQERLRGGILAEDYGLGKTLEIIALVNLNPRRTLFNDDFPRQPNSRNLRAIDATLIISPLASIDHWYREIKTHSPGLNVIRYKGSNTVYASEMECADIVLAPRNVLSRDITDARGSDLLEVDSVFKYRFWRVVLDDAHTFRRLSGRLGEAIMGISRVHSWVLTANPLRNSIYDLSGQLKFLGLTQFDQKEQFHRLVASKDRIMELFRLIGIRHTKASLMGKIPLPSVHRYFVAVGQSPEEVLHYESKLTGKRAITAFDSFGKFSELREACCITLDCAESFLDGHRSMTRNRVPPHIDNSVEIAVAKKWANNCSLKLEASRLAIELQDPLPEVEECTLYVGEIEKQLVITTTRQSEEAGTLERLGKKAKSIKSNITEAIAELNGLTQGSDGTALEDRITAKRSFIASARAELIELNVYLSHKVNALRHIQEHSMCYLELKHRVHMVCGIGLAKKTTVKVENDTNDPTMEFWAAYETRRKLLCTEEARVVNYRKQLKKLVAFEYPKPSDAYEAFFNNQAKIINWVYSELLALSMKSLDEVANTELYDRLHCDLKVARVLGSALIHLISDRERVLYRGKAKYIAPRPPKVLGVYHAARIDKLEDSLIKAREYVKNCLKSAEKADEKPIRLKGAGLKCDLRVDHLCKNELIQDLNAWKKASEVLMGMLGAQSKYLKAMDTLFTKLRVGNDPAKALEEKVKESTSAEICAGSETLRIKQNCGDCSICRAKYTTGSTAPCGHKFCKLCIGTYLSNSELCPVCNARLDTAGGFSQKRVNANIYEPVTPQETMTISRQPIRSWRGSKIDMIVRHILLLLERDPDTQVVVFSQWEAMSRAVRLALKDNEVRAVGAGQAWRVDAKSGKRASCLTLGPRANPAGLNLVNSGHLIICEPFFSVEHEQRALSYMHRLGAGDSIRVWQYYMKDTVEQKIFQLAMSRRKSQEAETQELSRVVGSEWDRHNRCEQVSQDDIAEVTSVQWAA